MPSSRIHRHCLVRRFGCRFRVIRGAGIRIPAVMVVVVHPPGRRYGKRRAFCVGRDGGILGGQRCDVFVEELNPLEPLLRSHVPEARVIGNATSPGLPGGLSREILVLPQKLLERISTLF